MLKVGHPRTSTRRFRARWWIFSDLDRTLLGRDYSDRGIALLVRDLARDGVVFVPCTSKTWAEMRFYLRRWKLVTPAIVENGGAAWIPEPHPLARAARAAARWRLRDRHRVRTWGPSYPTLLRAARRIAARLPAGVELVYRWDSAALISATGLSRAAAGRALEREHDVPLLLRPDTAAARRRLRAAALGLGLRVTYGGVLHHLTGGQDKGRAARALLRLAGRPRPPILALGDSPTDVSLLQLGDLAVVVPDRSRGYDREVLRRVPQARRAAAPAPQGWIQAIEAWRSEQAADRR